MKKTVVYTVTRNMYEMVLPSIKSLLYYNNIDKIYLLTENDMFPYSLPANVECINVSDQKYIAKDSPNYGSRFSYMVLLKPALTKILPQDVETVLSIDADTIILDDISEVFSLPLSDEYYFAGAREPHRCNNDSLYVNCGVIYMNLKKLRDGMDDKIIAELNTNYHEWPEQDVLNSMCQGHILEMPGHLNACNFTVITQPVKIRHFAQEHASWQNNPLVKPYKALFFDEVEKLKQKRMREHDSDPDGNGTHGGA